VLLLLLLLLFGNSVVVKLELGLVDVMLLVDKSMIGAFVYVPFVALDDPLTTFVAVDVDVGDGELDDTLYGI